MNRKNLIQSFNPSTLPPYCISVQRWKKGTHKNIKNHDWLGGRLTEPIFENQFTLRAGVCQIVCCPTKNCRLFLNLQQKKSISWKKAFPILKAFDCVSVQLDSSFYQQTKSSRHKQKLWVKKILLTALSDQTLLSDHKKLAIDFCRYLESQKKWFVFLKNTQQVLKKMNLKPVETPSLVSCPGTEPDLEVFKTKKHFNKKTYPVFLPSSPEMNLKKLLCFGYTDFYEIKKCFRNRESGPLNSCEFYLLEWYRAHSDWWLLMDDVEFFLQSITHAWSGVSCPDVKKVSMKSLFKKYLKMDIYPHSSKADFILQLKKMSIPFNSKMDISDLFYLLFLNGIEPALDKQTPLLVYYYPPFQRAYSRIGSNGWARRFELFWKGMELANAFDEIICPKEQHQVFRNNLKQRNQNKKTPVPLDYQLLHAMQKGMPPSVGVAFGLDRLFLILCQLNDLNKIRANFLSSSTGISNGVSEK